MANTIEMIPFPSFTSNERGCITVVVDRAANRLLLAYRVPYSLAEAGVSLGSYPGERKDELWKHNCLELFIGTVDAEAYWEFNFSLDGCWNCYGFSGYRTGMAEDSTASLCSFSSRPDNRGFQIDLEVVLPAALVEISADLNEHLRCCPSAVWGVPQTDEILYYAPTHGERPDFHTRDARVFRVI